MENMAFLYYHWEEFTESANTDKRYNYKLKQIQI